MKKIVHYLGLNVHQETMARTARCLIFSSREGWKKLAPRSSAANTRGQRSQNLNHFADNVGASAASFLHFRSGVWGWDWKFWHPFRVHEFFATFPGAAAFGLAPGYFLPSLQDGRKAVR